MLTVISNHLVFDVYEKLSTLKRWQPFMANFGDVGPYNRSVVAVQEVEGTLQDVGFVEYKCELINAHHINDFDEFWCKSIFESKMVKMIFL